MNEWIAVVQNNIREQLDHSPLLKSTVVESSQLNSLKNVMGKPCADCGALQCTWCAINFGCFLCIDCSGAHRSMTTSVSKIRSVTLDSLDDWVIEIQTLLGNDVLNSILEANVGDAKIAADAIREDRDHFIFSKYRDKSFLPSGSLSISAEEAIISSNIVAVQESILRKGILLRQGTFTPLHLAAAFGNRAIFGLITLNCRDLDILDSGGWSPLCYATFFGNSQVVEILLSLGADPNASEPYHPYAIAVGQSLASVSTILYPYWKKKTDPPDDEFVPPILTTTSKYSSILTVKTETTSRFDVLGTIQ